MTLRYIILAVFAACGVGSSAAFLTLWLLSIGVDPIVVGLASGLFMAIFFNVISLNDGLDRKVGAK